MTSHVTQTDRVTVETGNLRELITRARFVLFDFDGPICRLFAGHAAEDIAESFVEWLEIRGLSGVLTDEERKYEDPQALLRVVDLRHPGSDLVTEMEERLTTEEIKAAATAMPTPFADPLIRTWTAVGCRLAVTTNNSARMVHEYLANRELLSCFAPHIYGRTRNLGLLKPDPHCLNRALRAMGAAPSEALMIGDSPADVEAARQAGVPFLGYARNEGKSNTLRNAGADTVVDSLWPLLEILKGAGRSADLTG
ncbi:HAD family hydrolase [Streptomyces sp. NPDC059690]|uniref:HAD family hydrolase n=1 Tax=Streptomyces sp. NPDC059690 TaxID=3346907 RepID=UPI0036BF5D5F